ncbi:hypothetical protein BDY24DRAFT_412985 [Mrakia frigida]|uniref:uncharacterized protein n=1 Tax=Mrakia frigida TaxID=29902 RepID=UPI003FCC25C0
MSVQILWGRFAMIMAATTGLGYLTMIAVTPSPEAYYQALSPELKQRVDDRRRQVAEEEASVKIQQGFKKNTRIIWEADREPQMAKGRTAASSKYVE